MKTSELTGHALNWAVAEADGCPVKGVNNRRNYWQPSTDWSQGGPIVEREVSMLMRTNGGDWIAQGSYDFANDTEAKRYYGKTLLEAAMRCYVASKLGDEVEIPTELTQGEAT